MSKNKPCDMREGRDVHRARQAPKTTNTVKFMRTPVGCKCADIPPAVYISVKKIVIKRKPPYALVNM